MIFGRPHRSVDDSVPRPARPALGRTDGLGQGEAVSTSDSGAPADAGQDTGQPDVAGSEQGLGASAARGVLWMTAQKWMTRLGGLVTIVVLTRFLAPEDFGVVAAAMTVIPFVYLLSDMGFSAYVVQAKSADQALLSTSFWFSCVAAGVLGGLLFALAPAFALVFGIDEVTAVLRALVPSILFVGLQAVPVALLRRRMQFRALAAQTAVAAAIAQVVAIVLALTGAGVWALVFQQLVSQGVSAGMAWWASRWRPSLRFARRELAAMTRFGGQVVSVELVAATRGWAEAAIITNVLGAAALGYLTIARRLVDVTSDMSAAAILPVSTVVFARVRESLGRLRAAYLRALGTSYGTVSLPLTFVAVSAPLVVPLVFGEGWDQSIVLAQALALAGVLTLGAMLDHGLFYGLGKPGTWLAYAIVVDALTLATTAVCVRWGLIGVALGFLGVALVATVLRWVLVGRTLSTRARSVASPFGRLLPVMACDGLVGAVTMNLASGLPPLLALACVALPMLLAHVVLVRLVAPTVFEDVLRGLRLRQLGARLSALGRRAIGTRA